MTYVMHVGPNNLPKLMRESQFWTKRSTKAQISTTLQIFL